MKKKVIAAVVVVGLCAGVAFAFGRSPERRACIKLGELCTDKKGSFDDLEQCVDGMKDLRKAAGDEAMDKSLSCVSDAKSCSEASGCLAGAGMKAMQGAMTDFAKGFLKSTQ
jgi:hypothetical protein